MNKGLVGSLFGLAQGILRDILEYHPNLHEDIGRDIKRLDALNSNHGEKVYTLFLPALGKKFDLALEMGVLVFEGEPLARSVNRRTVIPRLFQGIWRLCFDDSGCLKQDVNPDDIRLTRTLLFAFKKYRMDCAPSATMKVIKEYYDVDLSLPPASQEWDGDGSHDPAVIRSRSVLDRLTFDVGLFATGEEPSDDARMLSIVQGVGDRISGLLGEFLPQESRFKHGPGAVSDLQTGKGYKYSFPSWGPRLQHVFPASEFAEANLSSAVSTGDYESPTFPLREEASILHAVPKTQKGPRLIASEPTANQWCQQSVMKFLTVAIRDSYIGESIDFRRQDLSGSMVLVASFDKSLATVDLTAASDRLSCWLIERLFRVNPPLLAAMIASRTRFIVNDMDKKSPKLHKLRKFASMGSALTFPIQSISFYILCVAAGMITERAHWKEIKSMGRQVRVYGDDLIVPVSWMPVLERLLELLYLKINRSKTFSKGNFRESCGTDAYKGANVSPGQVLEVFDESSLGTLQSVVDCANNLFRKGFINASNALLSPIPEKIMRMIPWVGIGSETFGVQTSSGFKTSSRVRWNHDHQYWEYQTFRFKAKKNSTRRHEGFANLLQYFTEDPSRSDVNRYVSGELADATTVVGRGWERLPA